MGTRERVTDRIATYRERVGMDLLVARTQVPGAEPSDQTASLERLAEICAAP